MMRTSFTAAAAAPAALLSLLLAGCSSTTHRVADVSEQGLVETDHIGLNEIRPAVEAMCDKIAQLNARGWGSHVRVTQDPPHKPQVRMSKIQNRTREHFDVVTLKNELLNAMVEQGVVYVVGDAGDLAAVNDERDYSQAGMTNEELAYGEEDVVALVLRGEITDDVIEQGSVKQHDYIFSLRLIDTVKNRVEAVTSTKLRKVRERSVFGG